MTKELFSIQIADVSAFARSLGLALRERHAAKPAPPGQVELLNLIARAHGQRNWQALRQQASARAARPAMVTAAAEPAPLDESTRKALSHFDALGRLKRWPVKFSVQTLVMWTMWARFDAKRSYTEREVNAILRAANLFSDHVTLRRELIGHGLMSRRSDGSDYRKLPVRPDDEARAMIKAWRERSRAGLGGSPREASRDEPRRASRQR